MLMSDARMHLADVRLFLVDRSRRSKEPFLSRRRGSSVKLGAGSALEQALRKADQRLVEAQPVDLPREAPHSIGE